MSKSVDFHRFKDMDLVEQVHNFGLTNIHAFGPIINLIRLFSLMLNCAKPRIFTKFYGGKAIRSNFTQNRALDLFL